MWGGLKQKKTVSLLLNKKDLVKSEEVLVLDLRKRVENEVWENEEV